jgi:hypothetical protein
MLNVLFPNTMEVTLTEARVEKFLVFGELNGKINRATAMWK